MQTLAEFGHLPTAPGETGAHESPLARASAPAPQRLGLGPVDQLPLASLATGATGELLEATRALAEALAGPDADASRRRTLSRMLACAKHELSLVDAAVGAAMGRGDLKAVDCLSKVAERLARRVCALLDEHRRELGREGPRAVMLIGAAQVNLPGGR